MFKTMSLGVQQDWVQFLTQGLEQVTASQAALGLSSPQALPAPLACLKYSILSHVSNLPSLGQLCTWRNPEQNGNVRALIQKLLEFQDNNAEH